MRYWYDGHWFEQETIILPVTEPGLLFGATVFTTLRVYDQDLLHPLTLWPAHLARLQTSVRNLQWQSPNWEALTQAAQTLSQESPVLRITLFPGGQGWIMGRELPVNLSSQQQQGVTVIVLPIGQYQRPWADLKTGNYLAAWAGLKQAQRQSATEAILTNDKGQWLETSTGNLWGWRDGIFYVPQLTGAQLAGISQQYLRHCLQGQGHLVKDCDWESDFYLNLTGLAYSNAVRQIIPIVRVQIDATQYDYPSATAIEFQQLLNCFRD